MSDSNQCHHGLSMSKKSGTDRVVKCNSINIVYKEEEYGIESQYEEISLYSMFFSQIAKMCNRMM